MLHVSKLSELVGLYMFQDKNQMVILEATIGLLWKVQTKTAKKKTISLIIYIFFSV